MTERNICLLVCLAVWLGLPAGFAAPADAERLIALAREHPDSAELASAIRDAFPAADLAKGTAVAEQGPDFFFAIESAADPRIVIDEDAPAPTAPLDSGKLHFYIASLATSRTHNFHYVIDGASFGGRFNVIAYGPESYLRPGVKPSRLTEKRVHTSTIYPGMQSNYWIYTPAEYDPKTPAAVMVWQDGEAQVDREGPSRSLDVIDNLTAEKKIPVIVHIFISPGTVNGKRMRSIEYDTVSDRYVRFLLEEILPLAAREYNLRTDSYSRAIAGESSGGICAFNAAWFRPDAFSRVISRVGSFTSIQWEKEAQEGGNDYPFKVRREAKRNIRVWLQDGFNDLENQFGSWPLQNIEMANSLKYRGYDFHLSFSNNAHGRTPGFAEDAEELTWLWRGYDASKTSEEFQMDPAERELPYYRVRLAERSPEK
jgi:enterochelin esterase-like enzyme